MSGNQHLPVNWLDGMKISRKHLEQTVLYTEQLSKNTASLFLNNQCYGILPDNRSLDITISCDVNQQIFVDLKSCKAITRNGTNIQLSDEDRLTLSVHFKEIATKYNLQISQAQTLFVIITINPFLRVPSGEPDTDENPVRHPFTKPQIKIDLLPAEQFNPSQATSSLVIGKLIYLNGDLSVDKNFIAPCTAVNSLRSLQEWHTKFQLTMENWEISCQKIMQKINGKPPGQQPVALVMSIQKLSEKILEQLARQKIRYKWLLGLSLPAQLCVELLENIQFTLMILFTFGEKEREEMLNYFAEWTDTVPGMLEKQTHQTLQLAYDHTDIARSLEEIYSTYQIYNQIFQKLAQLEFIGKKKGQSIFVIEQEVKENKPVPPNPAPKPNSRWSPLT
jgi:hypothetical protein